ncbi:hypothetical protein EB796_003467 [Bugula neritina]|uniref:Uncharacterized protein n=1 Tax=Bugula neritina TaxID=10212 RepID=A0A7J7KLA1_BUGNE|nr:hypothetical protein EB796_003467 [Bugula neritina]
MLQVRIPPFGGGLDLTPEGFFGIESIMFLMLRACNTPQSYIVARWQRKLFRNLKDNISLCSETNLRQAASIWVSDMYL